MPTRASILRRLLARDGPVVMPFAYDAVSARIIQECGFEAVGASGGNIAASLLAVPDIGLTTMTEIVTQTKNISSACELPVIADADNGYGNHANVQRTIREFEQAGVAGLFFEDQRSPKRCGHYEGTDVVPAEEMEAKIRAAVEARVDPDLVIVARTDARQKYGLEEAIARGSRYASAGADVIFVEAPQSVDELRQLPTRIPVPLMVNMVEGGRTPVLPSDELGRMGFRIVIWPDTAMAAAAHAVRAALGELKRTGTTAQIMDRLSAFEEMRSLLRFAEYRALDQRFGARN
ncbi:MAG: oxaloacetate decarboxylase [Alphaproteobacteria bacterium]|nr:oxaloacetate decarboxylase [Alphaproteobacteria bacterium]